ncbi:MAG: hypothetical protein MUO76_19140 [Anaerolineaceae bacterium]|nr:hypothetical protein [Anaerolineaceae bacterium]
MYRQDNYCYSAIAVMLLTMFACSLPGFLTGEQATATPAWTLTPQPTATLVPPTATIQPAQTSAPIDFCEDPKVADLIDRFVSAVETQNNSLLVELVHPHHGLTIRHNWWNPEVLFPMNKIPTIFTSSASYEWGHQDGSGLPIQGSFFDVIHPKLMDVFNSDYNRHCNTLEPGVASGGSAGLVIWPDAYQGVNYMALYRSAAVGDEVNWRTWAIGVVYEEGIPFVAYLVMYQWEI